jgi:hypothetical protein
VGGPGPGRAPAPAAGNRSGLFSQATRDFPSHLARLLFATVGGGNRTERENHRTTVFRYTLAIMLRSQRYLPPALLFVLGTGLFANGSAGQPIISVFAPMTGVAFICAAWLTVSLVNLEHPVQRTITAVTVGRSRSLLIAVVWVVLATCAVLAALALALPIVLVNSRLAVPDLVAGAEALLTGACFGTSIGMLTSRLVIRRPGYALVVTLILLALFLLTPGLPPINPLIRLLANHEAATIAVLTPTTGYLGIAIVALLASATMTQFIASHRD